MSHQSSFTKTRRQIFFDHFKFEYYDHFLNSFDENVNIFIINVLVYVYDCFVDECEFFVEIWIEKFNVDEISSFLLTIILWECCWCENLRNCLRYCRDNDCNACDHCHIQHFLQTRLDYAIHSWNFFVFSCFSDLFSCLRRFRCRLFRRNWRFVKECNNSLWMLNRLQIFHNALILQN